MSDQSPPVIDWKVHDYGTEIHLDGIEARYQIYTSGHDPVAYAFEVDHANMLAAAPRMLGNLQEAAKTLRHYEALHRAKNTEESTKKAEVNAALAARFEATIAKATEGAA